MRYRISIRAREQMQRRQIPLPLVEATLENPDQVEYERGTLKCYQSTRNIGGKIFLLRVIVDDSADPAVVVTAYRTTKIGKYWKKP